MRNFLVFVSITIVANLFTFCDRTENVQEDDIIYEKIEKTVTSLNGDSVKVACQYLIFEIVKKDDGDHMAMVKVKNDLSTCDAFNQIITGSNGEYAVVLKKGATISDEKEWQSVRNVCLDNFAGKRMQYIGFRYGFYADGTTKYHYGWIGVELSFDKSRLKIVDKAVHLKDNGFIQAGITN